VLFRSVACVQSSEAVIVVVVGVVGVHVVGGNRLACS